MTKEEAVKILEKNVDKWKVDCGVTYAVKLDKIIDLLVDEVGMLPPYTGSYSNIEDIYQSNEFEWEKK